MSDMAISSCERVLRYVRANAVGITELVDYDAAFMVMRCAEYDENDNAHKHGIAPVLADVGVKPVVARDKPLEGSVLGRIRDDIRGRRFVIARVDEPNLNVYFELGYAGQSRKTHSLTS